MTSDLHGELARGLHGSPAGIALFDPEDRLRHANPSFEQAFGVSAAAAPTWEQMLRDCHRLRHGVLVETRDIDAWIANARTKYRQAAQRSFEADLLDGRWLWVTESLSPDGWMTISFADVTTLKASQATLRKARDEALLASHTDPLTELHNRRHVFKRLADLLESARNMRMSLCVAVIDLDHFKTINDTRGHGAGDRVLKAFARQLRLNRRPLDVVGRIGGEEFLMVLPNATLEGAEMALARLQAQVGMPVAMEDGEPVIYSFSAGVTAAVERDTVDRLVGRADRALYLAKQAGRACYETLTEEGVTIWPTLNGGAVGMLPG